VYQSASALPTAQLFDAPIGAVEWGYGTIAVGELDRVHLLKPASQGPLSRAALKTGFVSALEFVPRPSASPNFSDLRAVEFQIDAPDVLTFHGNMIYQEFKCFIAESLQAQQFGWRLLVDETSAPWLAAHPRSGSFPGLACFVVNPQHYDLGTNRLASTKVQLVLETHDQQRIQAVPHEIDIRILPDPRRLRRILWVWNDDDTRSIFDPETSVGMATLAGLLAGPPGYFIHDERWGPIWVQRRQNAERLRGRHYWTMFPRAARCY
jgi:hypothetical protein